MRDLTVSLVQTPLHWHDPTANRAAIQALRTFDEDTPIATVLSCSWVKPSFLPTRIGKLIAYKLLHERT